MTGRYTVKPKADQDLDDYADYLTREALILYRPLAASVEFLRVVHGPRDLQALLGRRAEIE